MTWLNAQFTIDDAIARSQDVWDLYLSNWGNRFAPSTDGTSLVFPAAGAPALPSVNAIAIGTRSHIDRCVVQWAIQKLLQDGASWDYPRRVYVRNPLTFSQTGNRGLVAGTVPGNTNATGSVSIYSNDAVITTPGQEDSVTYDNVYVKIDGSTPAFGSALASPAVFIEPLLHLQFYLKAPTVAIPTNRLPFYLHTNMLGNDVTGSGVETIAFQIPVHGRRRAVVSMQNSNGPVTYRVGVLNQALRERTAATIAGVAASTIASTVIEPILGDWLTVYYTAGVTVRMFVDVIAED